MRLTLKVLVATIVCTVGGDGGCRVGEVRAGTTSPMPNHKGFKLLQIVNFQKFSTLRVNILSQCNKCNLTPYLPRNPIFYKAVQ